MHLQLPEQELISEHTPSLSTVLLPQKQPLVQGDCSLHLVTPVMLLQVKFQLQSRYSVPTGQAICTKQICYIRTVM